MGANLLPVVKNFRISNETFSKNDCAVVEGCAGIGDRKLLRFDFLCWNAGNADVRLGDPRRNPQWFEFSSCPTHRHYHLKNFNGYKIFDCSGRERRGRKQAFCLEDSRHLSPHGRTKPTYTCDNQGISAGWADLYGANLDCQWIDVTGLPDGDYVVEARTNESGLLREDSYGDNLAWAGVRLRGNRVSEIPVPCYPEDCLGFDPTNVQARRVDGSWKIVDRSHWILDFGQNRANAVRAREIIRHYRLNNICYVGRPSRTDRQLMMYFKRDRFVPAGAFPGEDAVQINAAAMRARQVGGTWRVTDGRSILLDFGVSEANARKAVWTIQKYDFRYQCFVGRPNPPMTYFRR